MCKIVIVGHFGVIPQFGLKWSLSLGTCKNVTYGGDRRHLGLIAHWLNCFWFHTYKFLRLIGSIQVPWWQLPTYPHTKLKTWTVAFLKKNPANKRRRYTSLSRQKPASYLPKSVRTLINILYLSSSGDGNCVNLGSNSRWSLSPNISIIIFAITLKNKVRWQERWRIKKLVCFQVSFQKFAAWVTRFNQ